MERGLQPCFPLMDRCALPSQRAFRGAIVGYGFISEQGHLPAYAHAGRSAFEIVAVADSCAARREKAHAALPAARIYECHEQLVECERGRIDFVDVTTPPCDHARVARTALTRGLHVLCEKPLATSAEDARRMVALARDARRVLFPCHNYKHAPVIRAVRRVLDSGALGAIRLATLQTFRNTHARGVGEWRPDWRRERSVSGGGIAMDHGSHTFYLALDWLGANPVAITAKMSTLGPYDTEDNFSCAITFPNATATAHLSWTAGVRKVVYTLHGERGAVRVEDDEVEVALMNRPADERGPGSNDVHATRVQATWEKRREYVASAWMDASHVNWFRSMLDDFACAIHSGEFVGRETESGVRCVELISRAYQSARESSLELSLGDA
jgi:predicted dehydrogenase